MDAALTILGSVIAFVVGLALAMLLVPVHVQARGVMTDVGVDAAVVASWGFGVWTVQVTPDAGLVVRLVGLPIYRYREPLTERERPARKNPASRGRPSPRRLARVVWRSVVSLRLRATVAGRLGAGDPADTATLYGSLALVRHLVPALDTRGLAVDWFEPALDLDAHIEGWLWPVTIAWIAIDEFAFQPRWHRKEA